MVTKKAAIGVILTSAAIVGGGWYAYESYSGLQRQLTNTQSQLEECQKATKDAVGKQKIEDEKVCLARIEGLQNKPKTHMSARHHKNPVKKGDVVVPNETPKNNTGVQQPQNWNTDTSNNDYYALKGTPYRVTGQPPIYLSNGLYPSYVYQCWGWPGLQGYCGAPFIQVWRVGGGFRCRTWGYAGAWESEGHYNIGQANGQVNRPSQSGNRQISTHIPRPSTNQLARRVQPTDRSEQYSRLMRGNSMQENRNGSSMPRTSPILRQEFPGFRGQQQFRNMPHYSAPSMPHFSVQHGGSGRRR
jgi:hypothetical protein